MTFLFFHTTLSALYLSVVFGVLNSKRSINLLAPENEKKTAAANRFWPFHLSVLVHISVGPGSGEQTRKRCVSLSASLYRALLLASIVCYLKYGAFRLGDDRAGYLDLVEPLEKLWGVVVDVVHLHHDAGAG